MIPFFSLSPCFRVCLEGTAGPSPSPPPPLTQTWVPSSYQWMSEGEGGDRVSEKGGKGALSLAEQTLQEKNNNNKIQPGLTERLSIFRTSLYRTGMSTGFTSSSGNFIKALTVNRRRWTRFHRRPLDLISDLVLWRRAQSVALPGSCFPPSLSVPSLGFSCCLRAR